ncbi:serine protease snake-like [Teleopsis dalmanni]|uniref:serine protease snake-like n=1 Tax=Teleopsis dalmanni TaxID=139649 RepID=UPI0018CF707B|nr:serine protease snake-like [Teleopsis dalmanni]
MWSSDLIIFCFVFVIQEAISSKILFPQIDDFPDECKAFDGSDGVCLNIKLCPHAFTARNDEVKTCYFQRSEQFVCCSDSPFYNLKERKSTRECKDFYPMRFDMVMGIMTQRAEFPYMAAVGWESQVTNITDYRCGGVMISNDYILTAAHCTDFNGDPPSVVVLGGVNLSEDNYTKHIISEVIPHPAYDPNFAYNDIALLKLKKSVYGSDKACLWNSFALSKTNVTAIGYGHTRFGGSPSSHLLKAYLTVQSKKDCQKHYDDEYNIPKGITDQQICAKDPENIRDTCQGDSGGPILIHAMLESRYVPYVVGITSFGQGCAGEPPGVYTRVSEYIDWIETTVWPN